VDEANADQADADGDGEGDVCDEVADRVLITLQWRSDEDIDMDLHVLHPRATAYTDREWDCSAGNPDPNWCDPGLDEDATGGDDGSEENIRLRAPEAGVYTVGVLLFSGEATATLTFNCGDNDPIVLGPQPLGPEENVGRGVTQRPIWEVLQFNPEDCSVSVLNRVADNTCTFSRGRLTCECEDCEVGACANCEDTEVCLDNACVDLCADVECAQGEFCIASSGECTTGNCLPCDNENDCAEGYRCADYNQGEPGGSFCAPPCGDGICGAGYSCYENILCYPNPPGDSDPEDLCAAINDDACDGCEGRCDRESGQCVECITDSDCAGESVCRDNGCVDLCAEVDCGPVEVCMPGTGECSAGNCRACGSEADCSDGDVCVNYNRGEARFCAPNCDDGPCPTGYFCRRNFERDGAEIDACIPNDPPGRDGSVDVCRDLSELVCAEVNCEEGFVCDPATAECVEVVVPPGADRELSSWGDDGDSPPECGDDDDCAEAESCIDYGRGIGQRCSAPCGDELACPGGFFCCEPRFGDGIEPSCVDEEYDFRGALCR